jgi:hypothetical protein
MGFWKKVEHWATHPFGDAHNAKQFVHQAANTTNRADKALAGLYGGIITGGISTEMGLIHEGVKDFTKDVVKKNASRQVTRVVRKGKKQLGALRRKIVKAARVPYKGKSQLNSARSGGNRRMAQIPTDAKRVYESRYFEVYQDSKGKKYLWGKPTLGPNSYRKDPAGFAREWGENLLRVASPKYRKSDPLEKDMARIKQKYGRMDHISGFSRGAAAARYQRADKNTTSRIYGSYTPYAGIGNHRNRRRRKFDFVHDVFARPITKASRFIPRQRFRSR